MIPKTVQEHYLNLDCHHQTSSIQCSGHICIELEARKFTKLHFIYLDAKFKAKIDKGTCEKKHSHPFRFSTMFFFL